MRMTGKICIVAALALLMAAPALAQVGTVKGVAKDQQGKPLAGATVEMVSPDTGRKYDLKVQKGGDFYSLGIAAATYNVSLIQNGQSIYSVNGFRVGLGDNMLDLDLSKVAAAPGASGLTEAQKKELEEIKKKNAEVEKENAKIKGLNTMLAQAKAAEDAGNPQQAVEVLTQATQADPGRDLLWANLADAQRMVGKAATDSSARKAAYAAAVESFNKAIAIKPTGAYYNNMGDAMARSGDYDGAIKSFNQAATMDPTNAAMYYFNEGAVLTNAGKTDDALAAFDKCIQANPNQAEAYYQKGVTLMGKASVDKTGKVTAPPEAAEAFNKYLELQPSGPNAQNAKDLLASIGAKVETTFGKGKAAPKKK